MHVIIIKKIQPFQDLHLSQQSTYPIQPWARILVQVKEKKKGKPLKKN